MTPVGPSSPALPWATKRSCVMQRHPMAHTGTNTHTCPSPPPITAMRRWRLRRHLIDTNGTPDAGGKAAALMLCQNRKTAWVQPNQPMRGTTPTQSATWCETAQCQGFAQLLPLYYIWAEVTLAREKYMTGPFFQFGNWKLELSNNDTVSCN